MYLPASVSVCAGGIKRSIINPKIFTLCQVSHFCNFTQRHGWRVGDDGSYHTYSCAIKSELLICSSSISNSLILFTVQRIFIVQLIFWTLFARWFNQASFLDFFFAFSLVGYSLISLVFHYKGSLSHQLI